MASQVHHSCDEYNDPLRINDVDVETNKPVLLFLTVVSFYGIPIFKVGSTLKMHYLSRFWPNDLTNGTNGDHLMLHSV
jgi:hypothetical protein